MTIFSSLYGTRLDRELGGNSTILFTTAKRQQAINEGAKEFAQQTECLTRTSTFAITGGTGEYDLNSTTIIPGGDFGSFAKEPVEFTYIDAGSNVTILAGPALVRRDILWLDRYREGWRQSTVASSVMQVPDAYYLRPDGAHLYLGFTPMPSTGSSASASVLVPYIADAPVMTSDTNEPFQFGASVRTDLRAYHQGLVHYGAAQLEKLRRDDQASDRQMMKFREYVARYFADLRIKGGRVLSLGRSYFNQRVGRSDRRERGDPMR